MLRFDDCTEKMLGHFEKIHQNPIISFELMQYSWICASTPSNLYRIF